MAFKSLPDNDNLPANDHAHLKCMNTYKNRHQRKHCCKIIQHCRKTLVAYNICNSGTVDMFGRQHRKKITHFSIINSNAYTYFCTSYHLAFHTNSK